MAGSMVTGVVATLALAGRAAAQRGQGAFGAGCGVGTGLICIGKGNCFQVRRMDLFHIIPSYFRKIDSDSSVFGGGCADVTTYVHCDGVGRTTTMDSVSKVVRT